MDQASLTKTTLVEPVRIHFSMNSQAAVQAAIQAQEQIHWTLGLRQAELIIDDKQAAVTANERKYRKGLRRLKRKELRLQGLKQKPREALSPEDLLDLEDLEDDLGEAVTAEQRLPQLLVDCQMELKAAQNERVRILRNHPEATEFTYQEIQDRFALPAFLNKQVRYVAAATWSARNQVPEAVGHLLFDLPNDDQRRYVMEQALSLTAGIEATGVGVEIAQLASCLDLPSQQKLLDLITSMLPGLNGQPAALPEQANALLRPHTDS